MVSEPIYALTVSDAYKALETSPNGLAARRLNRRSLAAAPARTIREPTWKKLIGFAAHPMALLLWVAGGVAVWRGEPALGVVIWIVVVVNAGFSYWREHRAEQATAVLQHLLPSYARVLRDGTELRVESSDLVAGDLLVLAEGDNIPADARVVEEYGLRVNNSVLTGEAVPARKTADASLRDDISEVSVQTLYLPAPRWYPARAGRSSMPPAYSQFGRIVA
jgi:magnesium-transporting ATPase (P-type)